MPSAEFTTPFKVYNGLLVLILLAALQTELGRLQGTRGMGPTYQRLRSVKVAGHKEQLYRLGLETLLNRGLSGPLSPAAEFAR